METGFYGFPGGAVPQSSAAPTGGGSTLILTYVASTDLAAALGTSAATWTDILANQSFTKLGAGTVLYVAVSGAITLTAGGNNASRFVIDAAGTPITRIAGGSASTATNALSGSNVVAIPGVGAGAHTIKLQLYTFNAGTVYLRAATLPNLEFLYITIWEA